MNEEKKLTELYWFRVALFGPLLISSVIAILIISNSNLKLDLSYMGFNRFVDMFKVPLSILALAFPLIALVSTNHRSSQASETLKRNSFQQTFSNYFTHREEFLKVLSILENQLKISFNDKDSLYKKLFPKNNISCLELISSEEGSDQSALAHHAKQFENLVTFIRAGAPAKNLKQIQEFYRDFYSLSLDIGFVVDDGKKPLKSKYFDDGSAIDWRIAFKKDAPFEHCNITSQVITKLSDFCFVKVNIKNLPTPTEKFKELAAQVFVRTLKLNTFDEDQVKL